jgi:AraC-like DNA-binding protein
MDTPRPANYKPCATMAPHRHAIPYAALVLEGNYDEMSIDGRFSCGAGTLVVHPAFHAHANEFGQQGAVVLDLPAPEADGFQAILIPDPEAIARLAQCDPLQAGQAALEEARTHEPVAPAPWLARLVAMLDTRQEADIASLAASCGVSAEHASRACKRWFGTGPAGLRREGRLRLAMDLLSAGARPAEAAASAGFSDQPHLTRLLKRATGYTPSQFKLN